MVCCKPFFENQLEDFAGPKKKRLKKKIIAHFNRKIREYWIFYIAFH